MVSIANLNITRRYTSGCCSGLTEVEPWWMMTNRPQNYHQNALDPPQRLSRAASPWLGSPFLLFQPVSAPTDWIEETNQTVFFCQLKMMSLASQQKMVPFLVDLPGLPVRLIMKSGWRQDGYGIETWIEGAQYQASSGRREEAMWQSLWENRGFWQPITMVYGWYIYSQCWLVVTGTMDFYDFPETIGNVIIPTDELTPSFFRGVGIPPTR